MKSRMIRNLIRQKKGLDLLHMLQGEEFSRLKALDPQGVAGVEFSLQELLRQMAGERHELRKLCAALKPGAKRLRDVLPLFDASERETVEKLLAAMDRTEQVCAKKAEQNYRMALGLYDQSRSQLDFIQKKLTPKKNVYSADGRMGAAASRPALLKGRF